MSMAFLERVKTDFKNKYGSGKADTAIAKSLTKEFGPIMKENMQYIIDHADEVEKLFKVKAQIADVTDVMRVNIDTAIKRGEDLNILVDKADHLHDAAKEFNTRGKQIRRKMWYQNMKTKLVVIGILLLLALILWVSICRGFNCSK